MATKPKFGGRATAFRAGTTARPERMRWSEPKAAAFRQRANKGKRAGSGKGGGS